MRYIKTYGAKGLLELKMTLPAGKAKVKIDFTDGKMGGNGLISAKYVTDNPALQALIEGSSYFRCGKVYLHGKPKEIKECVPAAIARQVAQKPMEQRTTKPNHDNHAKAYESECPGANQESCPDDGGDPAQFEC